MPCLFAVFEICHRSHSPLCSLFQIPKPTKIQVKIAQLIISPLLKAELTDFEADIIEYHAMYYTTNIFDALQEGDEDKAQKLSDLSDEYLETLNARLQDVYKKAAKAQTENLIKIMNQY